jgi:hypothetical protein
VGTLLGQKGFPQTFDLVSEVQMSIDTEALSYRLFTAADVDTLPTR